MLKDVRIDERTWSEGSESRRLEWTATIRELLSPGEAVVAEGVESISVSLDEYAFVLRSEEADVSSEIRHKDLEKFIHEYIDIVRQIAKADRTGGVQRLESLDMAKKVTHDKAARFLLRRTREFGFDHPTARRFFTLLLSLKIDTTRLVGVHGHRRI